VEFGDTICSHDEYGGAGDGAGGRNVEHHSNDVGINQQFGCAYRDCSIGSAVDHDAAGQSDSHDRTDGYVLGNGNGYGTDDLPVEQERRCRKRGDIVHVYNSGDRDCRQRCAIYGRGNEQRGQRNQQRGDIDSHARSGGSSDHYSTCK